MTNKAAPLIHADREMQVRVQEKASKWALSQAKNEFPYTRLPVYIWHLGNFMKENWQANMQQ